MCSIVCDLLLAKAAFGADVVAVVVCCTVVVVVVGRFSWPLLLLLSKTATCWCLPVCLCNGYEPRQWRLGMR